MRYAASVRQDRSIRSFTRLKSSDQPDSQIAIHIMVPGYNKEPSFRKLGRSEQVVEEASGQLVFMGLTGMRNVSRREDQIRSPPPLSEKFGPIQSERATQRRDHTDHHLECGSPRYGAISPSFE